MNNLSERLHEILRRKDMKQRDLSTLTGLSEANISNYLSGKYIPKIDTVERIAEVLNVSPIYLLAWENEIDESLISLIESDKDYADRLRALLESYDEFSGYKFTDMDIINIMDYVRFIVSRNQNETK